jgi:asparagine synthase (glutamine-hydrolysing)
MIAGIAHRGGEQDSRKSFINDFIGFSSINADGAFANEKFHVISDGEIYNREEIIHLLESKGYVFRTKTLAEIILGGYLHYGVECASIINGEFAFAIWDDARKIFLMCRDRLGAKPMFYTLKNRNIVFASEIKALFAFPDVSRNVGREGICEALGLLPRADGSGVFEDIKEVKSGHYAVYKNSKLIQLPYWSFNSIKNDFTRDEAVEHTRHIITDATKRRLGRRSCAVVTDIWSGVAASVAANELDKNGEKLALFTARKDSGDEFFSAQCKLGALSRVVTARDYPGANGDAELLLLYDGLSKEYSSVITGDCAEELGFWLQDFSRPPDYDFRKTVLSEDFMESVKPDELVERYRAETVTLTPRLTGEAHKTREAAYAGVKWRAAGVLERNDRLCAAARGTPFAARSPYTDCRAAEFFWNIPVEMKTDGSLIKDAFRDYIDGFQRGQAFEYNNDGFAEEYYIAVKSAFEDILRGSALTPFIDKKKAASAAFTPAAFAPIPENFRALRFMESFIQMEYWLKTYAVSLTI